MLGAGTFLNPLIKVVTTVVILAAIYLFIVKPTLDTTSDVVGQSLDSFNNQISNGFDETDSRARQDCIQRAIAAPKPERVGDRVDRCAKRFGP